MKLFFPEINKLLAIIFLSFMSLFTIAQSQTCPPNFNFNFGALSNWSAYTGENRNGNGPSAIKIAYNATTAYPSGTLGATSIPEYSISNSGININTTSITDPYGGFPSIPTINGYAYNYSVTLGSTNVSRGNTIGGYIRGISYQINVPTSTIIEPYTITYAYAMVLENGSHITSEQPMISANLITNSGIIACASPTYNLPTTGNGGPNGTGATIDAAAAAAQGFVKSSVPSPNQGNQGESQYRVYTKGWREVVIDLSPYRGQSVTLTFEADNCVPSGHFAYAYIALRNVCAGLVINGNTTVCANSTQTYSIPALANATYTWTLPVGWTIVSGQNTNIINVKVTTTGGKVMAHEVNGCADLYDTLDVTVNGSGSPGKMSGDATVCTGTNSQTLTLAGNTGPIIRWLTSTDGLTWNTLANTANTYTATNLTTTTLFRALVQANNVCPPDSSNIATITVNPLSVGGVLDPPKTYICLNQDVNTVIKLINQVGSVVNWQSSLDNGITWTNFSPIKFDLTYYVNSTITQDYWYRTIVKSGVCPADTSSIGTIEHLNIPFPKATISPIDTTICYATTAQINGVINIGTSYNWIHSQRLTGTSSGIISTTPFSTSIVASPSTTSYYILKVVNEGCPNALLDSAIVRVLPRINLFAGNDTNIVIGQPFTFQATTDNSVVSYLWSPTTALNNPTILQPTATFTTLNLNGAFILTYILTGKNAIGCSATDEVKLTVYTTAPSIFVPNAFTPNNDGQNDVIKPILAGILKLNYFRIYNRFGEKIFETNTPNKGWNGLYKNQNQDLNTFVYEVEAIDYTGKVLFKKGSFILIR